jgi:hypothetical protein
VIRTLRCTLECAKYLNASNPLHSASNASHGSVRRRLAGASPSARPAAIRVAVDPHRSACSHVVAETLETDAAESSHRSWLQTIGKAYSRIPTRSGTLDDEEPCIPDGVRATNREKS